MKQNEDMPYPGINMFMGEMPIENNTPVHLPKDLRELLEEKLENEQSCSDCYMQIPEEQKQSLSHVEKLIKKSKGQQKTSMNFNQYANEKYPPTEMEVEEFILETDNNKKPAKTESIKNKSINDNNNGFWKFNEDKTLKAAQDYISSTYHQHYTSEESKVQVLDIIEAIGDGVPFCRDNLIKYSARFGKKNGFSKLDALKIIHYGILLYNFAGFHNNTTDRYETF